MYVDATRGKGTIVEPREFLRLIPKTDLHVHLDGSIRLGSLIELAKERGVRLPSETAEGLRELVFKDRYGSLEEYLKGFAYTVAVLQDPEALERAAYELALDNFEEGVRYFEVRFAPQLHVTKSMDMTTVLLAVDRGLSRAASEFNRGEGIRRGTEPRFVYAITVCAMRYFDESMSPYYADLFRVHPFSPRDEVYALGSLELSQAAVAIRDRYGVPITGFDLAGQEAGFPAEDHRQAFEYAHKNFLKKTVHAGEAYGPESIFQAITDLHADRIGHGYFLLNADMIRNPKIKNREKYVRDLAEYIADRRITIEVCLTSNLQTNPQLQSFEEHSFKDMRKMRLSVTLCTDNRLVSNTTVTKELSRAIEHFGLTPGELKNIVIYGFKRSFFPGPYREKRKYVRKVIDFYEDIASRFEPAEGFWRATEDH